MSAPSFYLLLSKISSPLHSSRHGCTLPDVDPLYYYHLGDGSDITYKNQRPPGSPMNASTIMTEIANKAKSIAIDEWKPWNDVKAWEDWKVESRDLPAWLDQTTDK